MTMIIHSLDNQSKATTNLILSTILYRICATVLMGCVIFIPVADTAFISFMTSLIPITLQ